MSVSVRLPVCLSAALSRLYLKDYSSDRFLISYGDSTYLEDLVHFLLNVHCCPGGFPKTIHRIIFRFYIVILHILKVCNVVVLIDKIIEDCQIMEF